MHVTVKGKNLVVPQRIRDEAVAKLSKVEHIFDRFVDMEIVFSEDRNPRIDERVHCEVVLHGRGRTLRAAATAPDLTSAIDRAQARLLRQVRKVKTRALDRSRPPGVPDRGELVTSRGPDGAAAPD